MFAKYSEIVQLLLLLCVILHNCELVPITFLEPVMKSPDEITNHHQWPSWIWLFPCFFTPNNVSNCDEKIDLPENLNLSKHLVHQSDAIEPTPMQISLFPTKDSDERKDKEMITDNVQQKATTDINGDAQIAHVIKESNQLSDQVNLSIHDNLDDLALILPDPKDHKPNYRVPKAQEQFENCSTLNMQHFFISCIFPSIDFLFNI